MKNLIYIALVVLSLNTLKSQTVEYEVIYNSGTGLYESYAHISGGSLSPAFAGDSQFSIAVPASAPDTGVSLNSIAPTSTSWSNNINIFAPEVTPDLDYKTFAITDLVATSYSSFNDGDSILLFSFLF